MTSFRVLAIFGIVVLLVAQEPGVGDDRIGILALGIGHPGRSRRAARRRPGPPGRFPGLPSRTSPALFSRTAIGILVCSAIAVLDVADGPGRLLDEGRHAVVALAALARGPAGDVLAPGPLFHSWLMALRCLVNTKVVPLPSARRTKVMSGRAGCAPGLALAISGSFQFLILPRQMPA